MRKLFVLVSGVMMIVLFMPLSSTYALPDAQKIELEASDGLVLVGDFYRPASEEPVPAVILFHMRQGRRQDWEKLLPVLVDDYGIAVLNVDMRGHGETGSTADWEKAETDVQTWIDWLRAQEGINPDAISLIGASIGSNLAIRGWANDPAIRTAVALSPGLDYFGVTTADAVEANADRPLMLVASRSDRPSGGDVVDLFNLTTGDSLVRLLDGSQHGTQILSGKNADWLMQAIVQWVILQSQ
ncbi:MAG: alpha/beta fold hydrolase [Chloroflexi bacterium]|nr:alpha/beta fold hydrolase [Chloroflexota bacterium]